MRVSGDDHERLGEDAESLVAWSGNRAFMRMEDGHCAALRVEVATRTFVCSVYATRPEVCRALERGEVACQGEIATKAERPLLALGRQAERDTARAK